jgi:hypothetical protein
MKTKKSYSLYVGKDNIKVFFLFITYSEDMKNVYVITSESL